MRIKIIFGTDTGNTELVVEDLVKLLDNSQSFIEDASEINYEVIPVPDIDENTWNDADLFILGIPTWYDGELQSDWEEYFEEFKTIDFSNKIVAIFGLGDQLGYEEWFCDGVGILAKTIIKNGGQTIGWTDIDDSYDLEEEPKSMYNESCFYGLCLDEDNQGELTQDRLKNWVEKIIYEQRDYKYKHLQ